MRSGNPALNQNTFLDVGSGQVVSRDPGQVMTLNGTVNKTGLLLLMCVATAAYTWNLYTGPESMGGLVPYMLVGGIGVVAIMMISVTERTREIGVRKALGATRGEILFQFLVEVATLTLIGGMVGMGLGGLIALAINVFTPLPAIIPLWSVFAAILASVITGIFFGLYPANKAARLDPVEALRYE